MPAECLEYTYEDTRRSRTSWDRTAACIDPDPGAPSKHRSRCNDDWLRPRQGASPVRDWPTAKLDRAIELASRAKEPALRLDHELRAEIDRAKQMLEIVESEDEEYPIVSLGALSRAIEFLKAQSTKFRKTLGVSAPVPNIGPGPEGSVDLHWKRESWELLVNIPADAKQLATFYGDDFGAQKIKGSFDPKTSNNGIIMWLTNS